MKRLFVWLLMTPLAFGGQQPSQTPQNADRQVPAQQAGGIPGLPGVNYPVGPGDSIRVNVFNGNDYQEQTLTVAEDGTIFVPFSVNELINVEGKTALQIRELILEEMRKTFLNPVVQVVTSTLASKRATIVGEITNNGVFAINGTETLLDVIASRGGLSRLANLAEVQITHANGERLRVNLYDYILRQEMKMPRIEPGDVIYIPSVENQSNKYFMMGEFRVPGVILSQERIRLIEAVQRAGSLTTTAKAGQIFLVRLRPDKTTQITEIAFSDLYKKGNFDVDVPLESGDVIFAPKNKIGKLTEVAAAISPITAILGSVIIVRSVAGQ